MKLIYIETAKLKPNPNNLFPPLPPDEYADLRDSIAKYGIKEPLQVLPSSNGENSYIIQAGHNRWRAAKELCVKTAPCIESSPDMVEAVMDTEIFRRMLTREERDQYKATREQKQKASIEAYLKEHLLSEIMQIYSEGKIAMCLAMQAAQWPKDTQRELFDMIVKEPLTSDPIVIVEPDTAEQERHAHEIEKLEKKLILLNDDKAEKEKTLKHLRLQQDKAKELLLEKIEELETVKRDSVRQASEALRKEVETKIQLCQEQIKTSARAVKDKNAELDAMREEVARVKRMHQDTETEINSAWVNARLYLDKCNQFMRSLLSPEVITQQISGATHSLATVKLYLSHYDWEPRIKEKAMQDLRRLGDQIGEMLRVLPTTTPPQLPAPPVGYQNHK